MRICLNIEKGLIERIDYQRGDVPRSRVVERALEERYGKTGQAQKKDLGSGQ